MNSIKQLFLPYRGKELRQKIQQLFNILKTECGVDFSKNGGRLGNFEYYEPSKYIHFFIVQRHTSNGIMLKKRKPILEELIVNFASENVGRWISNEVKIFYPNANELVFSVNEPITHYQIKVWEKGSGTLVFASECAFIMEAHINIAAVSHKIIQDPWTQALRKNASKHKGDIQKIENVEFSSRYDVVHINSDEPMPWRHAKQEGDKLCALYKAEKTSGAFVSKTADRKGEIDSFQKVREYIEVGGI